MTDGPQVFQECIRSRRQSQEQRKVSGDWEVKENLMSYRQIRDTYSLTLRPLGGKPGAGTEIHAGTHRLHTVAHRHKHRPVYSPQMNTHTQIHTRWLVKAQCSGLKAIVK